ncbi:hypothetical protein Trydic_g5887 [Trypoxylus dichotomus]
MDGQFNLEVSARLNEEAPPPERRNVSLASSVPVRCPFKLHGAQTEKTGEDHYSIILREGSRRREERVVKGGKVEAITVIKNGKCQTSISLGGSTIIIIIAAVFGFSQVYIETGDASVKFRRGNFLALYGSFPLD